MRLLVLITLLCCTSALAQWGGDSRFYRTDPIPREDLVVDLDFSQFSYSGGVYTIRNMANAAAPAYMYGGLDFNSVGSDSSGLSRDIHTGRVNLNQSGAFDDSTVTVPDAINRDSVGDFTIRLRVKVRGTASSSQYFYAERLDTAYTAVTNAYGVLFYRKPADTLRVEFRGAAGSINSLYGIGKLTTNAWVDIVVEQSGNNRKLYVNNDSVWGFTSKTKTMRSNRIRLGGSVAGTSARPPIVYGVVQRFSRALTSSERTALYENATRGIHSKKKFSRW